MSLTEYTSLIRENERLKGMLRKCDRQLRERLCKEVKEGSVGSLTKAGCAKAMSMASDEIVDKFGYGFSLKSALNEFPCFTFDEIEEAYADAIRKKIQERMGEFDKSELAEADDD